MKKLLSTCLLLGIWVCLGYAQTPTSAIRLDSNSEVTNTILWRNPGINAVSSGVPISHSAIDTTASARLGNIRLFGSPFVDGYRISSGSPAFNTGTRVPLRPIIDTLDLDYLPRVNCENVDMGAYEFQAVPTTILVQPEDLRLCIDVPGALSVVAEGMNLTYQWQKDNVNISGATSSTLQFTGYMSDIGSYRVIVIGDCCSDTSKTVSVDIDLNPTLTLTTDETTVIAGGSFDLDNLIESFTGTVTWYATNPTVAPLSSSLVTNIVEAQTFIAVERSGACPDTIARTVMLIVPGMPCNLKVAEPNKWLCLGDSVRLMMDAASVNYTWFVAGTDQELEKFSWYTPTGNMKLVAQSNDRLCSDTLTITVHSVPFQIMSDLAVCGEYGGTEVQLISLPPADAWYRSHGGEKEYIGKGLPFVTIENNTKNVFIAEYSDGICPIEKSVAVYAFPQKINVFAPDTLICQGESVLLTSDVDPGIVIWVVRGTTRVIDPLVTPDFTTVYQAWVHSDACGDIFSEVTVIVQPRPDFRILNAPRSEDTIVHLIASPIANFWTSADGTRLFNPITVTDNPETYTGHYDYGVCRVRASISLSLAEETVPPPPVVNVTSEIHCYNDGWAYVTIVGTTGAPYTIKWSADATATGDTITGLASGGTYTVTVTDRFGQAVQEGFTVENIPPVVVTRQITQPTNEACNNASIVVNVSGGGSVENYVFEFCNGTIVKGESTWTMLNIGSFVHWMIVHDGLLGCVADTAYFGVFCVNIASGVSCQGCVGCLDLSVVIGIAEDHPDPHPFTVVWSNGIITDSITNITGDNFQITNLAPGDYTIRVYDRFRSFVDKQFTVEQPAPITATSTLVQADNRTCDNGRITVNVSGGVPNFNFEFWDGYDMTFIDNQLSATLNDVKEGMYRIVVEDAWGCTDTSNVIVLPCSGSHLLPNIFITPNDDGKNDFVKIRDINHYPNNRVIFINKFGEIVNEIENYNNIDRVWAGRNKKGQLLPDGVYYYIVEVDGIRKPMGGWVYMKLTRP